MRKLSDLTEEYVVKFCPTLASVTGLLGGYKVASSTGIRPLGGAILATVRCRGYKNWSLRLAQAVPPSSPLSTSARSAPLIRSPRSLARGLQSTP